MAPTADNLIPSSPVSTRSIDLRDGRTVSYVCIPPSSTPRTRSSSSSKIAVVHFGPLSACAAATVPWAELWQTLNTSASVITVDRPGCHETSPVQEETNSDKQQEDWVLQRLRVNTSNVLEVLKAEDIDTVYILAVCLGHAYAIHLARELLHHKSIRLKDISLVAPFISTACSQTWFLARLGNSVPSFVLSGATDAMMSIGNTLTPYFLSPSAVRKMLSPEEQAEWRDPDDYEFLCRMISMTAPLTQSIRALEARFGSSAVWQQIIDDFALRAGYGLQNEDGSPVSTTAKMDEAHQGPFLFPRIKIHVSPNDGMVTTKAAEWLARRCYADCEIVMHNEMSSHLTMTLLGGPPRNPRLLQRICRDEFGIVSSS